MGYIKLIDLVEKIKYETKEIAAAEMLGMEVFRQKGYKNIQSWYVQSSANSDNSEFAKSLNENLVNLGDFEAKIAGKILSPNLPVICISAPMGCGKTTVKDFVALSLLNNRKHCGKCNDKKRLISQIDFNEYTTLNSLGVNEVSIIKRLYEIINDNLSARRVGVITEKEEFIDFWNSEIKQFEEDLKPTKAFVKIISSLSKKKQRIQYKDINDEILMRKRLLSKFAEEDGETYLNYLLLLWSFIIKIKCNNNHGCSYIIFDNLDILHPFIQHCLIDIINENVKGDGPTFILLVRPETFDFLGMSTTVIDRLKYEGASPFDVVIDRLKKFCDEPEKYYKENFALNKSDFDILLNHAKKILQLISDPGKLYRKFIESACGNSKRMALFIVENLFYMPISEILNKSINERDLIRFSINSGKYYFQDSINGQIRNIFQVNRLDKSLPLIKYRILSFINSDKDKSKTIIQIKNLLSGFGYEKDDILKCLEDLMNPYCQLVCSNGFDYFNKLSKDCIYDDNKVRITNIGEGYLNILICDIRYIQEVMLDTVINSNNFPKKIPYNTVVERFKLLILFLRELLEIDTTETRVFISKWTKCGYFNSFGDKIISLKIIQALYNPLKNIVEHEKRGNVREIQVYDDLLNDYKSITLLAENRNKSLLDITVESIIEKN